MRSAARLLCCLCLAMAVALPGGAQMSDDREGGIIGTGIVNTGIVGIVTELGSIWVNGQHIRFDPTLPVEDGIGLGRAAEIRPGHTVAVVAAPDGQDWRARHIRQVLPLVGPVDAVDGARLEILGTTVHAGGSISGVSAGDWIAVSGLWREGEIVASRLERLPRGWTRAQVTGTYLGTDAQGGFRIGDTRILGLAPRHLQPGDVVRAFGTAEPGGLLAERLEKGLFTQPVALVQAEGYVSPPRPDGLYTVLGSGLVSYTDQPEAMDMTARAISCGAEGPMVAGTQTGGSATLRALAGRLGCPTP